MTESEAKLIESMADDYSNVLKEAKSMGCNDIRALYNIPLKNMELIINALEKQIPKKPEYEADGYADGKLVYDYAKCPICGHDFEYGINDWCCEYCSDCGQKLDWSDEE